MKAEWSDGTHGSLKRVGKATLRVIVESGDRSEAYLFIDGNQVCFHGGIANRDMAKNWADNFLRDWIKRLRLELDDMEGMMKG